MNVFSNFGTIVSVKIKKPTTSPCYLNYNSWPCTAYVNFETHEQALAAKTKLDGKQLLPGANFIRIEFYRKDNKFLGVYRGLDRTELINNSHYRVLFVRGLDFKVSLILILIIF